jgi:Fe2+ or Zn2+ uptake regulation protein
MMGRPPTLRLKVQKIMQEAHNTLSIRDICHLLDLDPKVHNNSIKRALMDLEARIVTIHRPRPVSNRRGGCKPINLWSL